MRALLTASSALAWWYLCKEEAERQLISLGGQRDQQRQHRQQPASFEIPLLGRIAAGSPVEAIAGRDTLNFSDFTGDPGTYALQVRGESMIEDHICDGDYVLVEHASEARDGDIVVALVDGMETTLKRFYLEAGDQVRLQPANCTTAIWSHSPNAFSPAWCRSPISRTLSTSG